MAADDFACGLTEYHCVRMFAVLKSFRGKEMSLGTELLSLRRNRESSVRALIAAMEWQKAAKSDVHTLARGLAVLEAADTVLLNVAVHASGVMQESPAIRTRRATPSRRRRRFDTGQTTSYQRVLFAVSNLP